MDCLQMYRIFTEHSGGLVFNVHLTPGASRTCINGLRCEDANLISIKISVHGKPVENKANVDLIKFIAEEFNTPKSHIEIIFGQKSRHKKVFLSNYCFDNIPQKIQILLKNELSSLPKTLFI